MDSSTFLGNNPLYLLEQLAEQPLIPEGSQTTSPKARLTSLYEKLDELEKNLDFLLSNQKTFGGFPKKFKKILKKLSAEIAKDKAAGHKLALKSHNIFAKIVEANLLSPEDIPANIVEANYLEKTDSKQHDALPSIIDLTQLAGTSKQKQVEDDFIYQVDSLKYPLADNSPAVGNLYNWLDIAAEKDYPRLLTACLSKLTTNQIMIFLSAPYVLQKRAIKNAVVKDLKKIQQDNPETFQRVFENLSVINQNFSEKEIPTNLYTNLEAEIIELALIFDQKDLLQNIFQKLKSYDFDDLQKIEAYISKAGFANFAKLFALYYSLSNRISPQEARKADQTLAELINKILKNKSKKTELMDDEENYSFSWGATGLLKQLITSLLDFQPFANSDKKTSERKLTITQPVTLEDLRILAQFYQSHLSMPKKIFDKIPVGSRFLRYFRNERLTEVRKIIPDFDLLQNSA